MEITEFSIANPSVHVGYDDSHSYRLDLSLSVKPILPKHAGRMQIAVGHRNPTAAWDSDGSASMWYCAQQISEIVMQGAKCEADRSAWRSAMGDAARLKPLEVHDVCEEQ